MICRGKPVIRLIGQAGLSIGLCFTLIPPIMPVLAPQTPRVSFANYVTSCSEKVGATTGVLGLFLEWRPFSMYL